MHAIFSIHSHGWVKLKLHKDMVRTAVAFKQDFIVAMPRLWYEAIDAGFNLHSTHQLLYPSGNASENSHKGQNYQVDNQLTQQFSCMTDFQSSNALIESITIVTSSGTILPDNLTPLLVPFVSDCMWLEPFSHPDMKITGSSKAINPEAQNWCVLHKI